MFSKKFRILLTITILLISVLLLGGPEYTPLRTTLSDAVDASQPSSALAAPQLGSLFTDDFESGTDGWNLDGPNWTIVSEGSNHILDGWGHYWAWVGNGQYWTDYTFTSDVKIFSGAVQLMFRFSEDHGRYILGITPGGGMYLQKESPWGKISDNLDSDSTTFDIDRWYEIEVDVDLNEIEVSVDGTPRLSYTDPSLLNNWPLWQGTVGLEVVPDETAHAQFDDIDVYGVISPERIWTRTGGPIGGLGYDIRYGSTTNEMYVTDNYSGVFKSSDNGVSWYPSNRGITGRFWPSGDAIPVFTLNVDPNDPKIVWAGLKDVKGVYKSIDSGMTWSDKTPDSTALPESNFVFRAFTVMPGNSDIVFAAGEIPSEPSDPGLEFDRVGGRVLRTDDGGDTWRTIWFSDDVQGTGGLPDGGNLTRYVIVDPSDHNIIYVSTGIFDREADNSDCAAEPIIPGGVGVLRGVVDQYGTYTWEYLGVANGLTDLYVGSLVMHPDDPNIMLAGTGNNACSVSSVYPYQYTGGVFITIDGGDSWTKGEVDGEPMMDLITSVEFSPSNPLIAYAAGKNNFYISYNGGFDWTCVAGYDSPQDFLWGPPGIVAGFPIDLLVDPENPLIVFANNYGGGNVKSEDGGTNWTLASQGYTGALLYDVEIRPENPGTVYTTGKSGIFKSLNDGSSWVGLTYYPADLVEVYSTAVMPSNPNIVIASTELSGNVYRSQDGGFTWVMVHELDVTAGRHGFKRIVFAPSYNQIVYAGSCVYHVVLNGDTTLPSYGVFKSMDGGASWFAAYASGDEIANTCVNNLAVHPTNPNIVYAATANEGLFMTTDGGAIWQQLNIYKPGSLVDKVLDIRSVAINPSEPNIVFAGTDFYGIYKTIDSIKWEEKIPGMEPNDRIWAIVFDPVDPRTVYAGSFLTGVYQWLPDEDRWAHINLGLRTKAVTDLAISSDGSVLYASTLGEGVFRLGEIPIKKLFLPLLLK